MHIQIVSTVMSKAAAVSDDRGKAELATRGERLSQRRRAVRTAVALVQVEPTPSPHPQPVTGSPPRYRRRAIAVPLSQRYTRLCAGAALA